MLLFFFQAEDGIRDWSVTGVQTCALPISCAARGLLRLGRHLQSAAAATGSGNRPAQGRNAGRLRGGDRRHRQSRSEERRGGEEGRSRGSPDHLKKKKRGSLGDRWPSEIDV